MIFLVQFGINKHLLIFFKDHKLHSPHGLVFIPNCTRNHVITYINTNIPKVLFPFPGLTH